MIDEVRRQLGGRKRRTAEGDDPPRADHGPCVEIASRFALRHLLLPGVGALVLPVILFVAFRLLSRAPFETSAAECIAAVSIAAAVAALFLSLATASAGASWSNARKYIATGAHGGRMLADETGSSNADNPTYVSASIGDAVGDALKDVGVPAIQLFARLLPILALVMLPFLPADS